MPPLHWSLGRCVLLLGVLSLPAACAPSMAELAERQPTQTWVAVSAPVPTIDCVRDAIERETHPIPSFNHLGRAQISLDDRDGARRLVGRSYGGEPGFIVSAYPAGTGSRVELRAWAAR